MEDQSRRLRNRGAGRLLGKLEDLGDFFVLSFLLFLVKRSAYAIRAQSASAPSLFIEVKDEILTDAAASNPRPVTMHISDEPPEFLTPKGTSRQTNVK